MINSDNSLPETSQASTAVERVHDITKERHALELRAEVINLVAGRKAERKGLSDRLEIGIESATDTAYGKEELHIGGELTEEANTAETTGLMLSTTVYGKLNLNYYSDTLITAGGMLEQYTGGEVIAAGMSDNLLGGGGIRIRGADLRMNAASAVEEKVSTLAIDGLVAECFSTACEREEGNAIYSVGFASYKGTMEVLTGTTIRPMCRALFGVRTKNRGGGGGGGDSNEPSPEQSPAAASPESSPPTDTLLPAGGSPDATMGGLYSTVKTAKKAGRIEDVLGGANNAITAGRSLDAANQLEELQNTDKLQELTNLKKLTGSTTGIKKYIKSLDDRIATLRKKWSDIVANKGAPEATQQKELTLNTGEDLAKKIAVLTEVKEIIENSENPVNALKRAIDIEEAKSNKSIKKITVMQLEFIRFTDDIETHRFVRVKKVRVKKAAKQLEVSSDSYLHRFTDIDRGLEVVPADLSTPLKSSDATTSRPSIGNLKRAIAIEEAKPNQDIKKITMMKFEFLIRLEEFAKQLDVSSDSYLHRLSDIDGGLEVAPSDLSTPLKFPDTSTPRHIPPKKTAYVNGFEVVPSDLSIPLKFPDTPTPRHIRPKKIAYVDDVTAVRTGIDDLDASPSIPARLGDGVNGLPPPRVYDGPAGANAPTIIKDDIANLSAPRQTRKSPIPSKRSAKDWLGNKSIQKNLDIAADQINITEVNKTPTDSPSQQVRVLQSNDSSSINPTLEKGATQWKAPSDVDIVLKKDPLSFDKTNADIFTNVTNRYREDILHEINTTGNTFELYYKLNAVLLIDPNAPQPFARLLEVLNTPGTLGDEAHTLTTLVYAEVAGEVTKFGGSLDNLTLSNNVTAANNVAPANNVTAANNVAPADNVTAADNVTVADNVAPADNVVSNPVWNKMVTDLVNNKEIIDDSLHKYDNDITKKLRDLQKQKNAIDNLDKKSRINELHKGLGNVKKALKLIDPGSPQPFKELENAITNGTVVNTKFLSDALSSIKKNITNAGGSLDLTPARIANSQDIQRIEEVIPPRYVDNISSLAEDVAHIPTTTSDPQIVFRATPTDPQINTNAITQAKRNIGKENFNIHKVTNNTNPEQAQKIRDTARIERNVLKLIEVGNANNPQLFKGIETAISDGSLNADEINIYQNILDRVKGEFQQLGGVDIPLQADDIDSSYHHITGAADGPHPTGSIPSTSESTFRRYAGLVVNSPVDNSGGFRVQGIIPDSVELSPSALGSLDESTPQVVRDILNSFEGNARNQPINIKIKKSAYGNKPKISLDNLKNAPREPGQQVNWTGNYQQANAVEPISATPAPDLPSRSFINSRPANTNNPIFGYSSTAQLGDNYEELSGLPFYSSKIDPINIDDFVELPPNPFTSPLYKPS